MAEASSSSIQYGSILTGAADLFSGIDALLQSKESSKLLKEEGTLVKADYFRQAKLVREDGTRVRSKQAMQYLGAGVELVGTPLLVLRQTLMDATERAESFQTAGIRAEDKFNRQAKQARRAGRAALIKGIASAGAAFI